MNVQQHKISNNFAYQGFTQNGDKRCFTFRDRKTQNDPMGTFSIEVDLPLLSKMRLPVQEGPRFCLLLLNTASLAGSDFLDRFHTYRLVEEDFHQLLAERERGAVQRAMRKPPRRPFRKPSSHSTLVLGPTFREG